jgi:hypothetical protein
MQSLHLLLQNVLLSGKLQKSCSENNRRKTKSAAAQSVLQSEYSELPTGDKKKADILNLLIKNHIPKFYATFMSPHFNKYYNIQGIVGHFLFCFFLHYDNNVIINV